MTYPHESYFDKIISTSEIANRSFDREGDSIRVALASGSLSVAIGSVKLEDATESANKLKVESDGSINTNIVISGTSDNIAITDSAGSIIDPPTLSSVEGINTTLEGIRDTSGIKKITDAVTVIQGSSGSIPWKVDYPVAQSVSSSVVDVTTEAILLLGYSNRKKFMIYNFSDTVTCFIGGSGVSIFNGMPVLPQSVYIDSNPYCEQESIYGVVQSGSCSIRIKEWR